jgi:hypothetical protein
MRNLNNRIVERCFRCISDYRVFYHNYWADVYYLDHDYVSVKMFNPEVFLKFKFLMFQSIF